MIRAADLIHLPYTRDLTEGGIAYAVRSLPYTYNRMGGSPYDRLRRIVSGVAVELAFRRYLSEKEIHYDVQGATPFTDPDHYDVSLAGRRCDLKSFLISRREQILELRRKPQILLAAPALVASDQNAAEGHRNDDIYLFAFLCGWVAASHQELQTGIQTNLPVYFVHVMPDGWTRPERWNPLGKLVLKSAAEETVRVEIGGQQAGGEMRSLEIEIPPRTRIQIEEQFFSLAYVHLKTRPNARLGIHSPLRKQTYIIEASDWQNIWVHGTDIFLAGYLSREEFTRRASFLREGARVFQYDRTRTKNLAVNVCDLRPVSDLLERVQQSTPSR
jgi:hypothetical protein